MATTNLEDIVESIENITVNEEGQLLCGPLLVSMTEQNIADLDVIIYNDISYTVTSVVPLTKLYGPFPDPLREGLTVGLLLSEIV